MKKIMRIILIILAVLIVLLTVSFIRHMILGAAEENLRKPLGQLVSVDGHNMCVYVEGEGKHTLVFLSGGGTCSPILDFKALYSQFPDQKIAVVEKYGYGFSDVVNTERSIDEICHQTREALKQAGVSGPYILCPHSMSGLEALYWAQRNPEEIEAIVGLDMAVPEYYQKMKINIPMIKLGYYGAALGLTRWIPGISESDAIKSGALSDHEKDIYRAIFYSRTATKTMINEVEAVKSNAAIVELGGVPKVPMLLFLSNGSGGTGFDHETWRSIPKEYISGADQARYIELDCPHYIHNYEYQKISTEIRNFLPSLEN